jgi:hypothetical protein
MASPGSFSEHGNLVKARKVTHACQQKTPDWRLYVEQTQRESRRLMGQVCLKAFTLGAFVYITAVTSLHSQVPRASHHLKLPPSSRTCLTMASLIPPPEDGLWRQAFRYAC